MNMDFEVGDLYACRCCLAFHVNSNAANAFSCNLDSLQSRNVPGAN